MARIIRAASTDTPDLQPPSATHSECRVLRAATLAASQEARTIIERARVQAEAIIERAHENASSLRTNALETAKLDANAIIVRANEIASRTVRNAEQELTQLAVRIAERILRAELTLAPEQIANVVNACIEQAGVAHRVTVRVNPADVTHLEPAIGELANTISGVLRIEPDPDINAGGCIVDTEMGQIDGRLEQQLTAIGAALAGRHES